MIENRQGKLKMHSKIALYASKSRGNVAVVLKDSAILMLCFHCHSICAISKECVLQHEKTSYSNTATIWKCLGNTVSRNILQYYAIIGSDATSFFYIIGKIN